MATEILTVSRAFCPLDLLLFQRYRREVSGLVEKTLALNPGLAAFGPYLPLGTKVTVAIPEPATRPGTRAVVTLWS